MQYNEIDPIMRFKLNLELKEVSMEPTSSSGNTGAYNFIVQPFPIHFDSNDLHVIVFFDGHPEYEAIEAMIQERDGKAPYIRAIITRRDKTQIDHINDQKMVKWLESKKRKREVYYTPISCNISGREGKKNIVMSFTSFKGERIYVQTSPASKASSKYGGLINPLGHSRYISLPVMYAEKSTLICSRSRILIDGEIHPSQRPIPDLWVQEVFWLIPLRARS